MAISRFLGPTAKRAETTDFKRAGIADCESTFYHTFATNADSGTRIFLPFGVTSTLVDPASTLPLPFYLSKFPFRILVL